MSSIHKPEYRKLLKRLKAARAAARLTQVEVAKKLGMTPIGRIEMRVG